MTIKELEEKLHTQIPMTKLMQLSIHTLNEKELITKAPLEININDKGTAFGGSLNTMTIISGWSLCLLISKQLKVEDCSIVIVKNETKFLKPVTSDLTCTTYLPSLDELDKVKEKLLKKGRSSINVSSKIIENAEVCVEFEGLYYISKNS